MQRVVVVGLVIERVLLKKGETMKGTSKDFN
jgi:hypothetical protein